MKKIMIIMSIVCLSSIGAIAQTVLTYNENAPQIGDVYHISGDNGSYDPGASGANQNWNFSAINPSFSYTTTAINPQTTPYAADFPEANIAFHYTGDNEFYSYAQSSSSEFLNDGVGFVPEGDNSYIHYTDAVKLLKFPFSFGESYSDDYHASYSLVEGTETHEWGTITVSADAWGSVTTPVGTFDNCLRIKSVRNYVDSIWTSGIFLYATTSTQTDYDWFIPSLHSAIVSISVTANGTSVTYLTNVETILENSNMELPVSIYQNTGLNRIFFRIPDNIQGKITGGIYDLSGRLLRRFSGMEVHNSLSIQSLTKGEYVIFVRHNGKLIGRKKILKL